MASAVLGKVSPTPKGEYVSTQDYARLDVVTYEGYPYLAKSNVPSGNLPTDELYWMPLLTGLDFAPGGYGLGREQAAYIPVGANLNTYTKNGWYYWSTDVANVPFDRGSMLVVGRAGDYTHQIAFRNDVYDVRIMVRMQTAYTWSEWANWSPSAFAPSGYGYGGGVPYVTVSDYRDEASYNAALDDLLSGMPSGVAKQIRIPYIDGTTMLGTVFNHYDGYATIVCYGYGSYGFIARKTKYNGIWSNWEWVNPPMQLGVEYRTTERWNGMPVYTKLVDCGAMPNNSTKEVTVFTGSECKILRVSGYTGYTNSTTSFEKFTLPYKVSSSYEMGCHAKSNGTNANIVLYSSYDTSGFGQTYVTVWYVKT